MPGISFFNKNIKNLLHPQGVDCPSFPWTFMGNPGMGTNPTQEPKMYSCPPSEKSSLIDLNLSLLKVSFLPNRIVIFK